MANGAPLRWFSACLRVRPSRLPTLPAPRPARSRLPALPAPRPARSRRLHGGRCCAPPPPDATLPYFGVTCAPTLAHRQHGCACCLPTACRRHTHGSRAPGALVSRRKEITGRKKRRVGVLSSARARETTMTKVASCPVHGPASTSYILLLAKDGAQVPASRLPSLRLNGTATPCRPASPERYRPR